MTRRTVKTWSAQPMSMFHPAVLLVFLVAFSSRAVLAQSTTVRAPTTASAVLSESTARVVSSTATTAVASGVRTPGLSDVATEKVYPTAQPAHDRVSVEGRGNWKIEQPPSIAAAWQPLNDQLEVFAIDVRGTLKAVWQAADGYWQPSFNLSAPGLAPPGAPLTAVWQPINEQLEVFSIGTNGALTDTWKAHNGPWFPPTYVTPPNYAAPGANLTAVFQPLNNQLEVFAIDATGAVQVAWKAQNGSWQGPVALTPPGSAPPGAPISAVWQPLNEQLEVFWIDPTGTVLGIWKQHNGEWARPFPLTAAGFANPRAHLAAVWQPLNEQLEVFTTDRAGAVKGVWKEHNESWQAPFVVDGPGVAISGAEIVATWEPEGERLSVVTLGTNGQLIDAFKTHNESWYPGPGAFSSQLAMTGIAGSWPTGAALAAVVQPMPTRTGRAVFTIDDSHTVYEIVEDSLHVNRQSSQITRANFGPIYGAHAAQCSDVFRLWSRGEEFLGRQADPVKPCEDFMGITAHCDRVAADRGHGESGFVGAAYSNDGSRRYFQCALRSNPEDVTEQFVHIAAGVGEGLEDAAMATVVYAPEIIQGSACLTGVAFACASLAIDLAARAVPIPAEVSDAADLVGDALNCLDEDVVSCAKLGAAGARAAGFDIPGDDAGEVALLAQQCADDEYGACVRLGEKAAMAAGVPVDQIEEEAKDVNDCYAGDADACIALGRAAANARIPVGGIADGAARVQQCSVGSRVDCQQLGEALAAVPR